MVESNRKHLLEEHRRKCETDRLSAKATGGGGSVHRLNQVSTGRIVRACT